MAPRFDDGPGPAASAARHGPRAGAKAHPPIGASGIDRPRRSGKAAATAISIERPSWRGASISQRARPSTHADREAELWPAAGPGRGSAPTSRVEAAASQATGRPDRRPTPGPSRMVQRSRSFAVARSYERWRRSTTTRGRGDRRRRR